MIVHSSVVAPALAKGVADVGVEGVILDAIGAGEIDKTAIDNGLNGIAYRPEGTIDFLISAGVFGILVASLWLGKAD